MEQDQPTPAIQVCCLAGASQDLQGRAGYLLDPAVAAPVDNAQGIVLTSAGVEQARAWLGAGVPTVLLWDAALRDAEAVTALANEFGPGRVGVYLCARRMLVSWTLDTETNADFNVMTPSLCQPMWEIVRPNGERTGTLAWWWIEQMLERGAAHAVMRVDIGDDDDLNLCADLVERFGDRLWVGPLESRQPPFADMARWGHAGNFVVPVELADHAELLALTSPPSPPEAETADTTESPEQAVA